MVETLECRRELWAWLEVEEGTVRFETANSLCLPETWDGCSLTLCVCVCERERERERERESHVCEVWVQARDRESK